MATLTRKIKFRAWDKLQKHMWWNVQNAYDTLGNHQFEDENIDHDETHYLYDSDFGEVLDNEDYYIMQFTGLLDENGKEIYEGDIVKEIFPHNPRTDGDRELDFPADTEWDKDGNMVCYSQVVFQNGAFCLESLEEGGYTESFDAMRGLTVPFKEYNCEVIGNIYDNPELLKAKAQNK